jgi:transposase
VALEATYGWEWLADLLEEAGYDVRLAHPLRTRAIAAARVKTDAVDAKTLAHLLGTGLLPEAYIAPPALRDLRELLRHRARADPDAHRGQEQRARAVGPTGHPARTHRPVRQGRTGVLASLELSDGSPRRRDSLLSLIGDFDREITTTTREIDARAKADDRVQVLGQIRGVGRYTAMLVIAKVGEVKRFPTARHLCAWAGLAPTVRSSDGKARLGHISHQGSPALRCALTEAAQKIPTGGEPLRAQYDRIAKRRGSKIAKVAVARQIHTLCHYGLRDGEIRCLKHQPIDDHDDHANQELAEAA